MPGIIIKAAANTSDISAQGYINVVDNIILDKGNGKGYGLGDFGGSNGFKRDRVEVLKLAIKNWVDENGNAQTLAATAFINNQGAKVEADGSNGAGANCMIRAEGDEEKHAGGDAKISVPLPAGKLSNEDDLAYLDKIVLRVTGFVLAGDLPKARKFLYGTMMLTRCM